MRHGFSLGRLRSSPLEVIEPSSGLNGSSALANDQFPKAEYPHKESWRVLEMCKIQEKYTASKPLSLLLFLEKQPPNELILRGAVITYPDKLRQQFIGAIAEYLMMKTPCHPV